MLATHGISRLAHAGYDMGDQWRHAAGNAHQFPPARRALQQTLIPMGTRASITIRTTINAIN